MKVNFVVHPFLFAVYPLLFFYSRNEWLFSLRELLQAVGIMLIASFMIFILLVLVLKKAQGAAIVTSVVFLAFFSSEAIFIQVQNFIRLRYFLIVYIALVSAVLYLILKYDRDRKRSSLIMNAMAVLLVIFPLVDVSKDLYLAHQTGKRAQRISYRVEQATSSVGSLPDIYYIILDSYAHESVLKEQFSFDNSAFYNYLSSKGFYIVPKSAGNYGTTTLSLASSLNMRYLGREDGVVSDYEINRPQQMELIARNEASSFLKQKGYTIVYVDSGFLRENATGAELHLSWNAAKMLPINNNLLLSFWNSAAPRVLLSFLPTPIIGDGNAVLYAFDKLKELPQRNIQRPIFVFAHILAPHNAFTLDEECNVVNPPQQIHTEGYLDKLACVNKQIKAVVDKIAVQPQPAIIILQSDHGEVGMDVSLDMGKLDMEKIPSPIIQAKLKNFTAIYWPDENHDEIPLTLTPVNLFRLIFNHQFNGNFELLENKHYYFCDIIGGCNGRFLLDVTEEVKF